MTSFRSLEVFFSSMMLFTVKCDRHKQPPGIYDGSVNSTRNLLEILFYVYEILI